MMQAKAVLCAVISAVIGLTALPALPGTAEGLVDSGMDYTESTDTLNNPGAGYTTTLWYTCRPGETKVQNPTGNLVLMFINIGAFSSGANGVTDDAGNYTEGVDYDLDETFFAAMRGTFENCRKNGCTVAVRFRYDANGKTNPEPGSFDQVLHHIEQIREDGFLEEYKDILMFVESGFVGAWGEQHSGKYTSLAYKAQLLDAVLDMTPDDIPVTVRTPNIFREWKGLDMDGMAAWTSAPGSREARVGMYNDGYMGSDSDLGTYSNRAVETAWLGRQTASYYGGEFSGNLEWAQKYDTYLPENAIPEMYRTHLSYINSNIYALYDNYTYSAQYDPEGADNTAYYGQTVRKFVRDHLGYRFTVRSCKMSDACEQGSLFTVQFDVENTGFAAPVREQLAQLLLERDGQYIVTEVPVDTREWKSCTTAQETLSVHLPGSLTPGEWNVYLRLSVGEQSVQDSAMRTVRFANPDIWNASLGANRLGRVTVTQTSDPQKAADQRFGTQDSAENAVLYTVKGAVIHDGMCSSDSEWTDDTLLAQDGDRSLWVTNDDSYLYIAARIPQDAEKPVINLRVKPAGSDTTYWYYRQSAGWIYYSAGDHSGIALKASGDFMEFRIAIGETMELTPGCTIESVRIFLQDEANEWKNVGEITGGPYTLTPGISLYSAYQEVTLTAGDTYAMEAPVTPSDAAIEWLHDGVSVGTGERYVIDSAKAGDAGTYRVRVTTGGGALLEQDICTVLGVLDALPGDLDLDGDVDAQDAALLQHYLHRERADIRGDADLNGDGVWNVIDLTMLKQMIHKA
ncbi:MAG: DUF4832 domain-containing protein [Oscillospiraceae bacterium]|nr:DUF4832 domain-containing protein [Oscillospiraceae bacterium]